MGRVDDAMRRAGQPAVGAGSEAPASVEADSASEFEPASPFVAVAERPLAPPAAADIAPVVPVPAVAAPVLTVPAVAEPVIAAITVAEPVAPSEPPSLFANLDARLTSKVVVDQSMTSGSREQYRRLAGALHQRQVANGLKVVMIASAAVGEGKTLTAANVALTLSESYQRSVLLIDADLRRPSLNTVFGLNGAAGLTEGLMTAGDWSPPLHQVSPMLTLLPAGKPSTDPVAALTSPRMRRLLEESRDHFAWVIVDTPPVGLLTDAHLLTSMVDGVVLVVEAGATPYNLVKRAVDEIGSERTLGIVLNRAKTSPHAYGYGYSYYGHTTEKADKARHDKARGDAQ